MQVGNLVIDASGDRLGALFESLKRLNERP
jgi:hypothetical protein